MANLNHNSSSRQFEENGSQGTPDTGIWELYFDSDGAHIKDDAGNVTDLGSSGATTSKAIAMAIVFG